MIDINWIVFFRALGFTILMPVGIGPTKIGLRLVLAFIIGNIASYTLGPTEVISPIKELIVGLALSVPLAVTPQIFNGLGSLFDTLRGQSISTIFDPFSKSNSPAFGISLEKFTWVILLGSGALEAGLKGIIESVHIVSVDVLSLSDIGSGVVKVIAQVTLGVWFSLLPFAMLCVAIEVVGVLAGKLLPKGSFSGEMFLLKSFLGICMVVIVLEGGFPEINGAALMDGFRTTILGR